MRDSMYKKVAAGIMLLSVITNFVMAQNEFFEPGFAVGGYGEFHYNSAKVGEADRSEEHTSELQSQAYLVCRLLLEKKKTLHS